MLHSALADAGGREDAVVGGGGVRGVYGARVAVPGLVRIKLAKLTPFAGVQCPVRRVPRAAG